MVRLLFRVWPQWFLLKPVIPALLQTYHHLYICHPRASGDLAMVARYKIPIRQPSVRWGAAYAGMTSIGYGNDLNCVKQVPLG